jgi:hypothetical protein
MNYREAIINKNENNMYHLENVRRDLNYLTEMI